MGSLRVMCISYEADDELPLQGIPTMHEGRLVAVRQTCWIDNK